MQTNTGEIDGVSEAEGLTENKTKARIMVIDDEPGLRKLLVYALGPMGHTVITAENGEEAIRAVKEKNIDIALCDVTMPKLGGIDTLRALKSIDPKIEVIMMTGYATLENAVESMKRGAYDFIAKPFEIDDLARIIDRALEKRRLNLKVDKLEEINRFKSEFLANMSHELRTPMNAILGYTSLQLDRVYGEITPKQEESLKRVEAAGRNLLQLINSILDLSKIAAGRMPVYPENFSIAELCKEVAGMMEGIADEKKLQLEWDIPSDLRIKNDKTKVKQILINMVTNGIKFTSRGGIFIKARGDAGAQRADISVRDTGIGIRPEDMPLLFQEFRQLDSSPTREYSGTGLGLAISKKLAELLGGAIKAESALGTGTVFTVSLPLENSESSEAQTTVFTAPAAGINNKILLAIDDDPEVLSLLRDNLHGTGYAFAGALTGEEGIAMAGKLKPFAITLDIMMPHKDGWSILQHIKNDPLLRSIPVIMVSILDNKSLGFALGAADYIVKPFERKELLEKLKTAEGSLRRSYPAEGNQRRKVLVADDEPAMLDYLKTTLTTEGYEVETAAGGKETLAKIKEGRPPDIIFLDLLMPGITGFDVLDAVDKDPNLKNTIVIILTAKRLTQEETGYLHTRVETIIQKGSKSLQEILAVVKKRLEILENSHE